MPESDTPLRGDVLRVDRGAYHHYGIYISDALVVQLGGRIMDKPRATIQGVAIEAFAKGGRIQVVRQEGFDRQGSVERALWLMEHPPRMQYHLFGYNCEHVARWCATGRIECSQTRNLLAFNSFSGLGFMFLVEHPKAWVIGVAQLLVGLLLMWLGNIATRQFEKHVLRGWRTAE
jgi:hypothetical protein